MRQATVAMSEEKQAETVWKGTMPHPSGGNGKESDRMIVVMMSRWRKRSRRKEKDARAQQERSAWAG